MSGQRHLRLTALILGALGAMRLLWLGIDMARAGAPSGWWLEAAFYALVIVTAWRLTKGSELAWFGAAVVYAGGFVIGIGAMLDLALSSHAMSMLRLAQSVVLLVLGAYGVWALLLSPQVKAVRHRYFRRDRWALGLSVMIALAVIAGVGWYLDGLSPPIQRNLAIQAALAALFVGLMAWLINRRRQIVVRWEVIPLVVAAITLVANLPEIVQLRELRPAAAAARDRTTDGIEDLAALLPLDLYRMTQDLDQAKQQALAQLESHTSMLGPWPLMETLAPGKITDAAAVDAAAAELAGRDADIRKAVSAYDAILERFAERRRQLIAALPESLRRKVDFSFGQEEAAYRSHYGARVNLLGRAVSDLSAMLDVLKQQRGHYTVDWSGAVVFEDAAAGDLFRAHRASLEELVVWNSRLRSEGADLAARRPSWSWLTAVD